MLAYLNADHAGAIDLWAQRLLGRAGSGWKVLAIDPEGCGLGRGGSGVARLSFSRPATDAEELRERKRDRPPDGV